MRKNFYTMALCFESLCMNLSHVCFLFLYFKRFSYSCALKDFWKPFSSHVTIIVARQGETAGCVSSQSYTLSRLYWFQASIQRLMCLKVVSLNMQLNLSLCKLHSLTNSKGFISNKRMYLFQKWLKLGYWAPFKWYTYTITQQWRAQTKPVVLTKS